MCLPCPWQIAAVESKLLFHEGQPQWTLCGWWHRASGCTKGERVYSQTICLFFLRSGEWHPSSHCSYCCTQWFSAEMFTWPWIHLKSTQLLQRNILIVSIIFLFAMYLNLFETSVYNTLCDQNAEDSRSILYACIKMSLLNFFMLWKKGRALCTQVSILSLESE